MFYYLVFELSFSSISLIQVSVQHLDPVLLVLVCRCVQSELFAITVQATVIEN